VHPAHGKNELNNNPAIARILADDYGMQIRLMPIDNTQNVRNPDAMIVTRNNELWEFKSPVTVSVRKQIFNSIKQAKMQKREYVLIKISTKEVNDIMNGFLDVGFSRLGTLKKIDLMYQRKLVSIDLSLLREKRYGVLFHILDEKL